MSGDGDGTISFFVPGTPAPGGSKRAMRHRHNEGRKNVPSDADARYRAMELLESLCAQHTIQTIVVLGDPISKARPRFTAYHKPYTPAKTIAGEKRIAAMMVDVPKLTSNVAVACLFFRASRQRIDVDNLLKAVLDAGTRARIWNDDSQVTALLGIVEYDREDPRTIICLGEHNSTLTRGDAAFVSCEACGKRFFPAGMRRDKARWCSRECRAFLAPLIDCPLCGKPFRRRSGYHKFCSPACRGIAQTQRAQVERVERTHCRRGHLLDEQNTYVLVNGMRRCRQCQAEQARQYRLKYSKKDNLE